MHRESKSALLIMAILMVSCLLLGCLTEQSVSASPALDMENLLEENSYRDLLSETDAQMEIGNICEQEEQNLPAAIMRVSYTGNLLMNRISVSLPYFLFSSISCLLLLYKRRARNRFEYLCISAFPGFLRDLDICQEKDGKKR